MASTMTRSRSSSDRKKKRRSSKSRASPLSTKTNQRRNTKAGRKQMATSQFALPKQRKYRIDDRAHAANALARVAQHGTPSEKAKVRAAVRRKYPSLGNSERKKKN